MHYVLTEQFLAKCYEAKQDELRTAAEVAAWFIAISTQVGLTTFAILEARERDGHILDLAGKGVSRVAIATRLGVDRATVFRAIREQQKRRRAALKAAS